MDVFNSSSGGGDVSFSAEYIVVPGGKANAAALTAPPPILTLAVPQQPYITHLLNLPSTSAAPLIIFNTSTEDAIHILDPQHLQPQAIAKLSWASSSSSAAKNDSAITDIIAAPLTAPSAGMLYTPSTNGKIAIWDMRGASGSRASAPVGELVGRGNPALAELGSRIPQPKQGPAYLCAAVSDNGYTLAAGTELRGTDAVIDIWDIRSPNEPLFTYSESHSDDVSSLAFCPAASSSSSTQPSPTGAAPRSALLLSGATDGLLSIFNTAVGQGDEDDAVVRVQNVGASLAKVGWGGVDPALNGSARAGAGNRVGGSDMEMDMVLDEEEDEQARVINAKTPSGLGGVWGVTDMQTLSVFDADNFDNTTLSSFPIRSRTSLMPAFEPDYVIDLWPSTRIPPPSTDASASASPAQHGLSLWEGDANGNFALLNVRSALVVGEAPSESARIRPEPWELAAFFPASRLGHQDIVRCVEFDQQSRTLITGGEDGKICFWNLGRLDGASVQDAFAKTSQPSLFSAEGEDGPQGIPVASVQLGAASGARHTVFDDDGTPRAVGGGGGGTLSAKAKASGAAGSRGLGPQRVFVARSQAHDNSPRYRPF